MCRGEPDIDMFCVDCNADTEAIGEYFHLYDEIWLQVVAAGQPVPEFKVLCIGCVETRLGRLLYDTDFTDAECNNIHNQHIGPRMRDRLTKAAQL